MSDICVHDDLHELDGLVGLASVKAEIGRLATRLADEQNYRARGACVLPVRRHLVFSGPAGVAKTKVARAFGQICGRIGALKKGHLVIVDRADLADGNKVAAMRETCDAALDGILYIKNEAFLAAGILRSTGDLHRDAVDVLIEFMLRDRDRLVVILDTRRKQLDCISFHSQLARRFSETIDFPAYTAFELVQILGAMAKRLGLALPEGIECDLFPWIVAHSRRSDWRNAREISNLFSKAIGAHALRCARQHCASFGGLDRDDFRAALAALRPDMQTPFNHLPPLYATSQPMLGSHAEAALGDSEA
ncbi:MAG: hypothetical protein ACLP8A_11290 [Methylovirgula sp.]